MKPEFASLALELPKALLGRLSEAAGLFAAGLFATRIRLGPVAFSFLSATPLRCPLLSTGGSALAASTNSLRPSGDELSSGSPLETLRTSRAGRLGPSGGPSTIIFSQASSDEDAPILVEPCESAGYLDRDTRISDLKHIPELPRSGSNGVWRLFGPGRFRSAACSRWL
eukprot:15457824-Alexandrium_andersonii.AAC.3